MADMKGALGEQEQQFADTDDKLGKRRRINRTPNWKHDEKKIFLDLVITYMPQHHQPTEAVWEMIAKQLQERTNSATRRTVAQCKQQLRDLKKSYIRYKAKTAASGSQEDDSLFALREEIETLMRRWDINVDQAVEANKYKGVPSETVISLTQTLETYQSQQLQFFQELIDNTTRLLDDHRAHEETARAEFQRATMELIDKISVRVDAAETLLLTIAADSVEPPIPTQLFTHHQQEIPAEEHEKQLPEPSTTD